jgi:Uma2 family endonuclease
MTQSMQLEPPLLKRRRFTADEYHRLAESGILDPDDRVELIEGDLIEMAPIGKFHVAMVLQLQRLLHRAVDQDGLVSTQNPLRLNAVTEPEPDLVVLKTRDDFYRSRIPEAADALLVIEVADSSLRFDRDTKPGLYANAGIPELWVIDIPGRCVWVYRSPGADEYADVRKATPDDHIAPLSFPGASVRVGALFD